MKRRFVYLVYCNKVPIVYGVYGSKKKALGYADKLIKWRRENASKNNQIFSYYHHNTENTKIKETDFDFREKTILSCCLKIQNKDGSPLPEFNDDACVISVVRRPLL